MGDEITAEGSGAQDEAVRKKEQEENEQAAGWLLGLLFTGAAWLLGKFCEWLFGPLESQAWWVWTRRVYFGGVYTVAAIQLCLALYQLRVFLREERVTAKAHAGERPSDDWPKDFKGWVKHIALALIGLFVLAAFVALCLAFGYVIEAIKAWFLSWVS